jgi:hypothetical protein
MQDFKVWEMLSMHLMGKETEKEKVHFSNWLNQSEENKKLFHQVKAVWDGETGLEAPVIEVVSLSFLGRFTLQKMKTIIFKQALGRFTAFAIGMWVTTLFSHHVLERRSLTNLFGLAGRKQVVVNSIPEWLQRGIAILIGFLVLEYINHLFEKKKHLILWTYLHKTYGKMRIPKQRV